MRAGLAAVACALLALTAGCGADGMNRADAKVVSQAAAPSEAPVKVASGLAKWGEQRPAGDALLVTVSSPRSFEPGATAYPKAPRAAGFDITIENVGTAVYRSSQLVVQASTSDGKRMVAVVDATQGYSGVLAGEVQPGRTARLSMAFALPADQVNVVVTVQSNVTQATTTAEFEGPA